MSDHTPLPWKWHPEFRGNDRIGSVYAEHRQGHAYAVAMQPKYQTPERWDADATLIVRSVNAVPALVKALEDIIQADQKEKWRTIEVDPGGNTMESTVVDGPCATIARSVLAAYQKDS